MFPKLGENLTQGYFALQKVVVTLSQLQKKVSKFSGSYCCLQFKDQMLVMTCEKT